MPEQEPEHSMSDQPYSCPSAQPDAEEARVFGIVGGDVGQPRLSYLEKDVAIPEEMLVPPAGISPTRIFRFAGTCIGGACAQFGGGQCQLGTKISRMLDPVTDVAPACTIRATCRWFAENGTAACMRCPQVVTTVTTADEELGAVVAAKVAEAA
jgi:hypothetical protein